VRTAGSVDNRPTSENLRRRRDWEGSVTRELFVGA
jgi:hypothetical protein